MTMAMSAVRRVAVVRSIPRRITVLTALTSVAAGAIAAFNGWPAWAYVLVVLAVWAPVLFLEVVWTYRHYEMLAIFYLLVLTQGGHYGEHVAQMVQIHILERSGAQARGIIGALDVEWVHLGFNSWVLLAVGVLLLRFRHNPWLWVAAVAAAWHEIEHLYIISTFLRTGVEGTPGLLAEGGRIDVGLGLNRPDLHFLYNTVETAPLFVAFVWQLRHTYNTWIARAFPKLSTEALVNATQRARTMRVARGTTVVKEGELGDEFFIVAHGEADVVRASSGARLARLRAGQFFGEVSVLHGVPRSATVVAATRAELLVLDRSALAQVLATSEETAQALQEVARQRVSSA